jgi:hypothetical protein
MAIVGAAETYRKLSSQVESQFPGFIREEGPQFVLFLKAYFEYLEQNGNALNAIRSIQDNQDIDRTVDSFVEYFRREFMIQIPKDVLADKRLLAKHISHFYRSRGSQDSYRFLFRAIFDKEIEFYYPGDDILRTSDGRWVRETILRVAEPFTIDPYSFVGKKITGLKSKASAMVRGVSSTIASGITVYDLDIESVTGTFVSDEQVFDEENNYVTVNADISSLKDITITDGGAFHQSGDTVEITSTLSSAPATAIVIETSDRSAVTIKLLKGGSGYKPETTKLYVTGGDGTGFQAKVESFELIENDVSINTDTIESMANVRLNESPYFVRNNANTSAVPTKLVGTVKLSTGSNTVVGQGTVFNLQLAVGDIVRVKGQANTLRVHSITTAQSFVTAIRPTSNQLTGANAYIGLAAANVSSVIGSALKFSTSSSYSVNAITIINPGKNYTVPPTISIIDTDISPLNLSDGFSGIYGRNAVVVANNATGAIKKLRITEPGENFNKNEIATIRNKTQSNNALVAAYDGLDITGAIAYNVLSESFEPFLTESGDRIIEESNIKKYVHTKKTFNGQGVPVTSGQKTLPGRYIDTKGFLSWNNKLQDNLYYQEFSYVIRVTELVEKYRDIIKNVLHPAGTKMFGDYKIISSVAMPAVVVTTVSSIIALSVSESLSLTDTVSLPPNVSESITASDIYELAQESTESVSASDTVSVTANMTVAIVETAGGVISVYASTVISPYDSITISDFLAGTLNLDDSLAA